MNKDTCCNNKKKNTLSFVAMLGILLVLCGLILFAFNIGWLNPAFKSVVFSVPMLLILLALIGFAKRQKIFPTILLLLGVFFILPRFENIYPGFLGSAGKNFTSNFWPLLLIIIGLLLIIEVVVGRKKKTTHANRYVGTQSATGEEGGWVSKDIVFGSSESVFLEPVFRGGDLDVAFGGIVIDLRKTTLPDTIVHLYVDVVFGGVTLYVPEDWSVKSDFDSAFGGYSDKRPNTAITDGDSKSKLVLKGSLFFSGCTVQ